MQKASGQGTEYIKYGKRVVQFKKFEWYYYRTEKFDIYHYIGGKQLARYTADRATEHLKDIEKKLDYRASDRVTLVIYNNYTDLKQSNIGFSTENDNPGGLTPIVDNMGYIYFNGNHFDFIKNLRAALSEVLINEMLYGGSIQERVQNSALINIPEWQMKGLREYFAQPWSTEDEMLVKQGILSGRFKNFIMLSEDNKALIGKAVWRFVADSYGEEAIGNVVYLTRINKNIEGALSFVIGKTFDELYRDWYNYYEQYFFQTSSNVSSELDKLDYKGKIKKKEVFEYAFSKDGNYFAYATNDLGLTKVYLLNLKTGKSKRLLRKGFRNEDVINDRSYPLLVFHPQEPILTILDEDNANPVFKLYNYEDKKWEDEREIFRLEKITSLNYSPDGRYIALSGIKNGQSDLYIFNYLTNALRSVTNDIFDDLHPVYTKDGRYILFSSNRSNDTIISGRRSQLEGTFTSSLEIFRIDVNVQFPIAHRLTYTPLVDEIAIASHDSNHYAYMTDQNGIKNRNVAKADSVFQHSKVVVSYRDTAFKNDTFVFYTPNKKSIRIASSEYADTGVVKIDTSIHYKDTAYSYSLSNYSTSPLHSSYIPEIGRIYHVIMDEKRPELYVERIESDPENSTKPRDVSYLGKYLAKARQYRFINSDIDENELKSKEEIKTEKTPTYFFQSEFENAVSSKEKEEETLRDRIGSSRVYFTSFKPDHVLTQINNELLFTPYLPFDENNGRPIAFNPVLNAMFSVGMKDVFHDYRLVGGMRLHGNLRGADYFISYENLKKRLDKKLTFFRIGQTRDYNQTLVGQESTQEIRYTTTYPFSKVFSIQGEVFGRRDNIVFKSTEANSLQEENNTQNWLGGRTQLTFDNSLDLGMNLWSGSKLAIYGEVFREVDLQLEQNTENRTFYVVGADMRHSVRLVNKMIWANRVAGAMSLGGARVAYFLGGIDNWLFPSFNNNIQVENPQDYQYKSLGTNLRGFTQNIRNGSAYAAWNSELRIPVFKLFARSPIRSNFLNNFLVVGFTDWGTAWNGLNPFNEENTLSSRVIQDGNLTITVRTLSSPLVGGYGFGFRSTVLGYYLKLDFAWGVENFEVREESITYLSFGFDF